MHSGHFRNDAGEISIGVNRTGHVGTTTLLNDIPFQAHTIIIFPKRRGLMDNPRTGIVSHVRVTDHLVVVSGRGGILKIGK